jgi:DNA-binding transcriptional ArsR family regulator
VHSAEQSRPDSDVSGARRGWLSDCLTIQRDPVILQSMLHRSPDLDQVFSALSDPTRRRIVEHLGRGPATVSAIAAPLPMSLPGVLQHLQVLERSGLVTSTKAGRVRTCRLEPERLTSAEAWMAGRRQAWERRLDRLGQVLAGDATPPIEPLKHKEKR